MKKETLSLVAIVICFIFLMVGIFIGRDMPQSSIYTQYSSEESQTKATSAAEIGKIDINTAGRQQLMLLPNIGETLAEAIIDYREANGAFIDEQDICNVKGIGKATFEKISDYITVGGSK